MNNLRTFLMLFCCSAMVFYGCKDEKATNTTKPEQQQPQPLDFSKSPAQQSATGEPAQNAAGVYHYICSKGCPGGAGAAGNCPTCGGLLAHNTAYHNNTNSATPSDPFNQTPATNAGRNAAGVWHYSCPSGCSGGSGSAGNCGTCGETLAHNAAYHQ